MSDQNNLVECPRVCNPVWTAGQINLVWTADQIILVWMANKINIFEWLIKLILLNG